jgi:phenylacetate-coenzyme A ligase PaaK-like adenylate-forming protein
MFLPSKLDINQYHLKRQQAFKTEAICGEQLKRLNDCWKEAVLKIDRYKNLVASGFAPGQFSSLEEYIMTVPVLSKNAIQMGGVSYTKPSANIFRVTGGSTSEPVQIPSYKSEFDLTRLDGWLGRNWWEIDPGSKMFLFWGHAHLLGSGFRGRINAALRIVKDRIQRYDRISCYNLSYSRLREVGERLLKSDSQFVVGYSHALDALARANEDRKEDFREKRFKAIIATAESLPMKDSRTIIESTFCAPLAMEYGSVETGPLAHTAPDNLYHVFWDNYLIEYNKKSLENDVNEVIVTSLYHRCTPLFRYVLGDQIVLGCGNIQGCSLLSFSSVVGRSNLFIEQPDGRRLHSEVVSHIVRDCPKVRAYQFVCGNRRLFLDIVPNDQWSGEDELAIRAKARKIDLSLESAIEIRLVSELRKTVAGKLPMVVYVD